MASIFVMFLVVDVLLPPDNCIDIDNYAKSGRKRIALLDPLCNVVSDLVTTDQVPIPEQGVSANTVTQCSFNVVA